MANTPETVALKDKRGGWLATFTKGAYTVTMAGPQRTFTETGVTPAVTHAVWVRTLPTPFAGDIDMNWMSVARDANKRESPDVLAIAMQYVADAPPMLDGELQIAGDASYGPLIGGKREEGSDFSDYLGIAWKYRDGTDQPEARQFQCLDCSGFMRMIWGYRRHLPGDSYASTIPLCRKPRRDHGALPRRAVEMYDSGTGVLVVRNTATQTTDFSAIGIGDFVFFDADPKDGEDLDHVGMYLGRDSNGHHRFISSRKTADGPTMGDRGGKSVLDGTGLYARTFRAVRRV